MKKSEVSRFYLTKGDEKNQLCVFKVCTYQRGNPSSQVWFTQLFKLIYSKIDLFSPDVKVSALDEKGIIVENVFDDKTDHLWNLTVGASEDAPNESVGKPMVEL